MSEIDSTNPYACARMGLGVQQMLGLATIGDAMPCFFQEDNSACRGTARIVASADYPEEGVIRVFTPDGTQFPGPCDYMVDSAMSLIITPDDPSGLE